MEQLFFIEPRRVEWRDVPRPDLTHAEDALVRPIAVSTCDVDTGLMYGLVPYPGPFPLGHEGVGEVIEVGPDVTTVSVGQRVIIPFQISCGRCVWCQRGLTASCERVNFGAMYGLEPRGGPWGGFLSDLVRVPWANHTLVPLPEDLAPAAVASLSDNIPDAWRIIAPYASDPATTSVLIVAGPAPSIPFYTIAIAKALGVEVVDYLELQRGLPNQRDKATRAGATVLASRDEVRAQSYTVTVFSISDAAALRLALRGTAPDGTCVVSAIFFNNDKVPVPMFSMYTRGARLVTGRVNARAVLPQALDLVVNASLQPETITDAVVGWRDAADALVAAPRKARDLPRVTESGPPPAVIHSAPYIGGMAVARTPRSRWIDEGLQALAAGGPDAVRVETLALALGVTKGGFYWHFDDRGALLDEMLDAFERLGVDEVIARVERDGGDARAKLRRLLVVTSGGGTRLKVELAIRDWARRDKTVARRLRRVDNRRMEYLRSLFGAFCGDEDEVEVRSMLTFSLFIASHFIVADHRHRSRAEVVKLTHEWLLE